MGGVLKGMDTLVVVIALVWWVVLGEIYLEVHHGVEGVDVKY